MSVSQDPEEERPETPLALDTALSSSAETATTLQSPSTTSTASSSSHQFVLPIPTPSTNRSRASFSLPDQNDEAAVWSLDSLPPEIKKADVSIARAWPCYGPYLISEMYFLSRRKLRGDTFGRGGAPAEAHLRPEARSRQGLSLSVRDHRLCKPAWEVDVPRWVRH